MIDALVYFYQLLLILFQSTHESLLLLQSLEATVSELAGSIDELQVQRSGLVLGRIDGLAESQHSLLDTNSATLQHQPILSDNTVVRESTNRSNGLLRVIELSGGIVLLLCLANAENTLVHFRTMVVTVLTSTRDSELDTARMPSANTGNLAKTLVGLARKTSGSPTSGHTLESLTLGDTKNIDVLVEVEDVVNTDLLLQQLLAELDLLGDSASVDLDFHDVGLLLAEVELPDLGVGDDTHNGAVLLDALKLASEVLGLLSNGLLVLGEGLLLGAVPVLVESSQALVGQMAGPDGGQSTKTVGGLDVTDKTDNNHRGALNDGDSLASLTVVPHLGSREVDFTKDVGHASLVSHEGSQMGLLLSIVTRESSDAATDGGGSLAREKPERSVPRALKLAMGHA
jgi:hypothetical protein